MEANVGGGCGLGALDELLTSIETRLADVDDGGGLFNACCCCCCGSMLCIEDETSDDELFRLDGGIIRDWVLKLVSSDALLPTFTRVLKFDATELGIQIKKILKKFLNFSTKTN